MRAVVAGAEAVVVAEGEKASTTCRVIWLLSWEKRLRDAGSALANSFVLCIRPPHEARRRRGTIDSSILARTGPVRRR